MKNDVVIIGAGHAGGMTAISLRQEKYQGSITLIVKKISFHIKDQHCQKDFLLVTSKRKDCI